MYVGIEDVGAKRPGQMNADTYICVTHRAVFERFFHQSCFATEIFDSSIP